MVQDSETEFQPQGELIDEGADSIVYRFGNEVVKFYKDGVSPEQILLYQKVTNQAAKLLVDNPFEGQIKIGDKTYKYTILINPISSAGEDGRFDNKITTVSPYISGPNLLGQLPGNVPFKTRDFSDPLLPQLDKLSDQLSNQLGVEGILIAEPNIKFNYEPDGRRITLTVTDLSTNIWAFKEIK